LYHEKLGRPSLALGLYFRVMMIGFFEGLDSERGIAWRLADSLLLRQFLSTGLDEKTPDHVTTARTRRLIDAETHRRIWVLERLAQGWLIRRKTIGVDSTTLEANAAMKSIRFAAKLCSIYTRIMEYMLVSRRTPLSLN
jgi:transposase